MIQDAVGKSCAWHTHTAQPPNKQQKILSPKDRGKTPQKTQHFDKGIKYILISTCYVTKFLKNPLYISFLTGKIFYPGGGV